MGIALKRPEIVSIGSITANYCPTLTPETRYRFFKNCVRCKQPNSSYGWCQSCESANFRKNFSSWTSGNNELDQLIRKSQRKAITPNDCLEWIPFKHLEKIELIAFGGFGEVSRAIWVEGPRFKWDERLKQRIRIGPIEVALKEFYNSEYVNEEFLDDWYLEDSKLFQRSNIRGHTSSCYGISQNPNTKNFILVMEAGLPFHENCVKIAHEISWMKKLEILYEIVIALSALHSAGLIHGNLHEGNILFNLKHPSYLYLNDIGCFYPVNESQNAGQNLLYGVLPYLAPELLIGGTRSAATDIYSFGMIMYSVATGKRPFFNCTHDEKLASKICRGTRPKVSKDIPESYAMLMKRCLDEDYRIRQKASIIADIIEDWMAQLKFAVDDRISKEFKEAEEIRKKRLKSGVKIEIKSHSEAVYISRLLDFPKLR